ncbi:MAG TPA: pre-16S rRNA-processing nuclease YqgF [bacterium]|nr:pre-16S rRNA-processing nuclease YqgF [bacterium]
MDPGLEKCGMAVCGPEGVLAHRVVGIADLEQVSRQWMESYRVEVVIVGNQTGCKQAFDILNRLELGIEGVPERNSTLLARRRYFRDHPPRGWRRLLPISLQVPPEPYDDYAAVVLAEAYLARRRG